MNEKFINALSIAETEIYDEAISAFPQDPHDFSKKHKKKMEALFWQMRDNKYHILTRSAKRMIIIAAIIAILAVTSFAFSPIREFFVQSFEKYSSIIFDSDSDSPKKVEDDLICGYIPEGFELSESSLKESACVKKYTKDNNFITIRKLKKSSSYDLNTEDNDFKELSINNMKYFVNYSNNQIYIVWNNEYYGYSIKSTLSEADVLEIAKQVE